MARKKEISVKDYADRAGREQKSEKQGSREAQRLKEDGRRQEQVRPTKQGAVIPDNEADAGVYLPRINSQGAVAPQSDRQPDPSGENGSATDDQAK